MTAPSFPTEALAAARDAAKAHLRISNDSEDALIAANVAAALELCEAFTGLALIEREWRETLIADGSWRRLTAAPVRAITSVAAGPAQGPAVALSSDAYAIDLDGRGEGWLRVTAPGATRRVDVAFTAGIAVAWNNLPAALAQGVVVLAAHLIEARTIGGAPPAAVAALWRPWRRMRLSGEEART